jgi:hypothetical protein
MVAGLSGMLAVGLTSGAYAATGSPGSAAKAAAYQPAWRPVLSVPNGTRTGVARTVIATGKTSGWTFLSNGTTYQRTGATRWKKVASPGGTAVTVGAAGASSPSNVWVAGGSPGTGTKVYRWNGVRWSLAKSLPSGAVITGLSVLGPNDVWLFGGLGKTGEDGVFHFNGRTWTQVAASLEGGSALSDRSVWGFNTTQIAHYDGRKWTATSVAKLLPAVPRGSKASSYLTNVIALAPNNVYATGEDANPLTGPAVLLHYNGRSWSRVAASAGFISAPGNQLASDGKGGLWIAAQHPGVASNEGSNARLIHYSAAKLTIAALPTGGFAGSVSRIPGTAEALAAGVKYGTGNGDSVVFQYS